MIILFEGVDAAGKSTFIEKASKKIPCVIIKTTDRPKDSSEKEREKIKEYYKSVIQYIKDNPGKTIILDRFFPSEIIYSYKREYDASLDPFYGNLERWLAEQEHVVVFCNPGRVTIWERLTATPDEHVTPEEGITILEKYETYFSGVKNLNVERFDTSLPVEELVLKLEEKLNEHTRQDGGQGRLF